MSTYEELLAENNMVRRFMGMHGMPYDRSSFARHKNDPAPHDQPTRGAETRGAEGRAGKAAWAEVAMQLRSLGRPVPTWKAASTTKAAMSGYVMPALRAYMDAVDAVGGDEGAPEEAPGADADVEMLVGGLGRLDVRDIQEIVRQVVAAIR